MLCGACCGAVQGVVEELAGEVEVEVEGGRDVAHQLLLHLRQHRPQQKLPPGSWNKTLYFYSECNRIEDYKKDKIEKFRIKSHWCRMVDF